jgi:hypothetical protein
MSDDIFTTGPWTGFYNYTGPTDKHRMDLHLAFCKGRISGEGSDNIGRFLISGTYDTSSQECNWVKQYIGQHAVYYQGIGEKRGIWGAWRIIREHGGFHIWPLQSGSCDTISQAEELTEPAQPSPKILHLVEK